MKQIEERAISSALGKNYDELYSAKQAVYGEELKDISAKEVYNEKIPERAELANQVLQNSGNTAENIQDMTQLQNHKNLYGDKTEKEALSEIPTEFYGHHSANGAYISEGVHKKILANEAAAGKDVSGYYNKDGSMKTLEQTLQEDLDKASREYDENIGQHENPLINGNFINQVLQEEDIKLEEITKKQKQAHDNIYSSFVKNDTDLAKQKQAEQNNFQKHIKDRETAATQSLEKDYQHFKRGGLKYDKSKEIDYISLKVLEDKKNKVKKIGDTKEEERLNQVIEERKRELAKQNLENQGGTYVASFKDPLGKDYNISYKNQAELEAAGKQALDDQEWYAFRTNDEQLEKVKKAYEGIEAKHKPLTTEQMLERAKKLQIEDERKNFEGTQKLRELQNEQLQKQIDAGEQAFGWEKKLNDYNNLKNRMNANPNDISDDEINKRISAKGLDKVDDQAYYNSIFPNGSNQNIEEIKKTNRAHKEDLVRDEIRKEKELEISQAQTEFQNRISSGKDLQTVNDLGPDKYKEEFITNNPLKLQIEANKEMTKQEGAFKSSFDINKENHLKSKVDALENVKKEKEVNQDKQKKVKDDFKNTAGAAQRIIDRTDPTKHSKLMEHLKQGAPDEIFKKDLDLDDPSRVGGLGHVFNPHTFNPRQQELMNVRTGNQIPEAFTNKELLQEAVAAKPSSFMGKQAQKLLRSGPDHNIGMQTRHMVLGGSMLAGAAFGSKRKDHSRGFNSHRGNRI